MDIQFICRPSGNYDLFAVGKGSVGSGEVGTPVAYASNKCPSKLKCSNVE